MNRPPQILLGVSGGIAAYKSAELVRELVQRGASVRVAMTRGAHEFVAPLTFQVLSGHDVYTEVWGPATRGAAPTPEAGTNGAAGTAGTEHVNLADWADLLLVAPATAHTLAKLANGFADDFLSTYFLAHRGPVLLAPAMESAMWANPAVRRNLEDLAARGIRTIGPDSGFLASGHEGPGRMSEPAAIAEEAWRLATGAHRDLAGLRVLVTAGPTREPIDPIRFVSNRSSGKMGHALAEAARDRGAAVTLLTGAADVPVPAGLALERFDTSDELHALLLRDFPECDALIMAAAVADFQPEACASRLHRASGEQTVRLRPARDVLASLRPLKRSQTVVAFAAETEELEARGRAKLEAKGADLIVVNDVGRPDIGFDADENEVLILSKDGGREHVSRRGKREIAERILDALAKIRRATAAAPSPAHR
ncbi:MAG TPA: bifunctional phosphopantothenoylcysteine decarboxylase/phosphopantothenate--cysteine ligase CoaBC [Thermoanaerobaculia bacterium]|jgi:phosphopantothenoylcysteine decarboxylase/phosphopantothenate--cysteine ligase